MHRRIRRIPIAAGVVALFAAVGAAAFNPQPEPPAFGIVGLARSQSALLHVVLVIPPEPVLPGDAQDPLCRVTLSFVDAAGQSVLQRSGVPLSSTVDLRPGVAETLKLGQAQPLGALLGGGARTLIRPVLRIEPRFADDGSPLPDGGLVATLEIVNALGETQVLYAPGMPFGGIPPDDNAPQR